MYSKQRVRGGEGRCSATRSQLRLFPSGASRMLHSSHGARELPPPPCHLHTLCKAYPDRTHLQSLHRHARTPRRPGPAPSRFVGPPSRQLLRAAPAPRSRTPGAASRSGAAGGGECLKAEVLRSTSSEIRTGPKRRRVCIASLWEQQHRCCLRFFRRGGVCFLKRDFPCWLRKPSKDWKRQSSDRFNISLYQPG